MTPKTTYRPAWVKPGEQWSGNDKPPVGYIPPPAPTSDAMARPGQMVIIPAGSTTPIAVPAAPLFPDVPNPIEQKLDDAAAAAVAKKKEEEEVKAALIAQQASDKAESDKRAVEDTAYLQNQNANAAALDASALATAQQQATANIAGSTANLSQGREGPQSSSNPLAISSFTATVNQSIADAKTRASSLANARGMAQINLERAINDKNDSLVKQYSNELLSLSQQQASNRNELLNNQIALTNANTQQAQEKRASTAAFFNLLETGVAMDIPSLTSYAESSGLPLDMVVKTYQKNQDIRDAKGVDEQTKAIALKKNKQDLQNQIDGIQTAQAQNLNRFQKLKNLGVYSDVELQDMARALGIDLASLPENKAKLTLDQANAAIANYKAKYVGKTPPVGSAEYLDYKQKELDAEKAQYELDQATGDVPASQIQEAFTLEGTSKYRTDGGWECGEGANKITNGTKVGDSYSSKMATVTKQDSPQVGNELVIPIGAKANGHIGTVVNYNPITQTVKTVEWNHNGDGQQTIQTYNIADLKQQYGDNWGFSGSTLKPEYQKRLEGVQSSGDGGDFRDVMNNVKTFGGTVSAKKDIEDNIKYYAKIGDKKAMQDYVRATAFKSLGQTEEAKMHTNNNIIAVGEDLKKNIEDYTTAGGDMGIFTGSINTINNKIGKLGDPKQQGIALKMRMNLENFARSQTGAAIQDFERVEFGKILPTIFDGKELALAKIDAFANSQKIIADNTLKQLIGESAYSSLFPSGDKDSPQNWYNQWNPLQESLYSEYNITPE